MRHVGRALTLQQFPRASDFELAEDAKELLCDNGLPRFFQINNARFEFVNTWVSLAEGPDSFPEKIDVSCG